MISKYFTLLVLLLLSQPVFSQQSSLKTKDIKVDSLLLSFNYASKNLLLIEDKFVLIHELLQYEGSIKQNPSWTAIFNPVDDEYRSSELAPQLDVTNESIALYLIEATIRDSLVFRRKTYPGYIEEFDSLGNRLKSRGLPSLGRIKDYVEFYDDGLYRELKNLKHYKAIFQLYKNWFRRVQFTIGDDILIKAAKYKHWLRPQLLQNIKLEDLTEDEKNVLKGSRYFW